MPSYDQPKLVYFVTHLSLNLGLQLPFHAPPHHWLLVPGSSQGSLPNLRFLHLAPCLGSLSFLFASWKPSKAVCYEYPQTENAVYPLCINIYKHNSMGWSVSLLFSIAPFNMLQSSFQGVFLLFGLLILKWRSCMDLKCHQHVTMENLAASHMAHCLTWCKEVYFSLRKLEKKRG